MALTNCAKCGHRVSDKAERCPGCKTTEYLSSELSGADTQPIIGQVSNHLPFLGYKVGDSKIGDFWRATHNSKATVLFRELLGGLLLFAMASGSEGAKSDRTGFLSYINSVNANVVLIRCSCDNDSNLVISAWYPHRYEQGAFARFMDQWNSDIAAIMASESEVSKYLERLI